MAATTATMALPSPAANRPAYLDNMFRVGAHSINKTPSLRSAHSSISSTASLADLRSPHTTPRPLSPTHEEEDQDDCGSIRSLRLQFSPRRTFRNLVNRRTYPQVQEIVDVDFLPKPSRPSTSVAHDTRPSTRSSARRPSLPKLQTSLSSSKLETQYYASKPLPQVPVAHAAKAQDLRCQPCYYFAARNCNGYVFGGGHGDACENCLASGFFGAS